jgi:hypothetical protein
LNHLPDFSVANAKQFVGRWIAWRDGLRFEQELYENGKFEALIFDEDDTIAHAAIGTWEIAGDTLQWRYLKGGPKYIDKNRILSVKTNQISIRERDGERTVFYRGPKGGVETSSNFDRNEVSQFLNRLSALIDSGFASAEASRISREMKRLIRESSRQYVFPIRFEGGEALLGIRVFMDDVDAPDLYFYAPLKLMRKINEELEKLDKVPPRR